MATKAPLGIAAAKRAIRAAELGSVAALLASAREVNRCLASADFREAARAKLEQREPAFRGQ